MVHLHLHHTLPCPAAVFQFIKIFCRYGYCTTELDKTLYKDNTFYDINSNSTSFVQYLFNYTVCTGCLNVRYFTADNRL